MHRFPITILLDILSRTEFVSQLQNNNNFCIQKEIDNGQVLLYFHNFARNCFKVWTENSNNLLLIKFTKKNAVRNSLAGKAHHGSPFYNILLCLFAFNTKWLNWSIETIKECHNYFYVLHGNLSHITQFSTVSSQNLNDLF